tara:strand:- start:2892 stop:3476 length:585 start_codon:yes stop_codon:yes gene_type:complete
MADFIIKSAAGTGNKTLIQGQDQSGSNYAIQVGDAGASTLHNATLTTATITAGTFPAGHVLQVVVSDHGGYVSHSNQVWTDCHEVTITNVKSGSKVIVTVAIGGALTENSGTVGFRIVDSSGSVLSQSQSYTGGTSSWHGAVPTLIGTDTSPSVGTNSYKLQMQPKSTVSGYYNYGYSTDFDTKSFYQLMEVSG